MSLDGKLQSAALEGFRAPKLIPIVIRYAAGVPSVLLNPLNEDIALTDNGTGDVSITLASASLLPLLVQISVRPTDPAVLGLLANLSGAPTTTVVRIVVNSGADGATETDPVDLHVWLWKQVVG